jgi:hypothetical protein
VAGQLVGLGSRQRRIDDGVLRDVQAVRRQRGRGGRVLLREVGGALRPLGLALSERVVPVREVAAIRRSNGTKAASCLAPGPCRRPRIVADRQLGRAVGHRTEHRPEQDE